MTIMPSRYQHLVDAVQGFQQTGIPLVAVHGTRPYPAGFGDDIGIYYFIPGLVRLFGITIDQAISLFYIGLGVTAFLAGTSGLFLLYRQANQRAVLCVLLMAATSLVFLIGDVYLISFFVVIAAVPWILYAVVATDQRVPYVILPAVGFLIPLANMLRSHSGTTVGLFVAVLLATGYIRAGRRGLLVLSMVLAASIPLFAINHLVHARNTYLTRQEPDARISDGKHPFWHSVYIGLGFLNNPYVKQYRDEVAIEKVRSVDPKADFLSQQYDRILKHETLRIVREHPAFIAVNLAAKAGVILLIFIASANVGLLAARARKKPWQVELAFAFGLLFSTLFGFLVMPYPNYLLGFIGLSVLYSIISIARGLEGETVRSFAKKLVSRDIVCAES